MVRIYLVLFLFLYLGSKFNLFSSPLVWKGDDITQNQIGLTLVFIRQVDRSEIGRVYNVGDMITVQRFHNQDYFVDTEGIWHNAHRLNYNYVFYDPEVNGVIDASINLKTGQQIKILQNKTFSDGSTWAKDLIVICTAIHPSTSNPKFFDESSQISQWTDFNEPNFGRGVWWQVLTQQPNFNNPDSNYFNFSESLEYTFGDYIQISDTYFRDTGINPEEIKLGFWGKGSVHTDFSTQDRYSNTLNTSELAINCQISKEGDNLPQSFKLGDLTWDIDQIHPIIVTQGQYRYDNSRQFPFRSTEVYSLAHYESYINSGSYVLTRGIAQDGSYDFALTSAIKYLEVSFKFSYKVTHDIGNSFIKEFIIEVPININVNPL